MRSSIKRDVKLKAFANFLFDFFIDLEYKNKSVNGAVCIRGDTYTLTKQMVTYLNVNIAYQEVCHLAD